MGESDGKNDFIALSGVILICVLLFLGGLRFKNLSVELKQQIADKDAQIAVLKTSVGQPIYISELPEDNYRWSSAKYVFVERIGGSKPIAVYGDGAIPDRFTVENGKIIPSGPNGGIVIENPLK